MDQIISAGLKILAAYLAAIRAKAHQMGLRWGHSGMDQDQTVLGLPVYPDRHAYDVDRGYQAFFEDNILSWGFLLIINK